VCQSNRSMYQCDLIQSEKSVSQLLCYTVQSDKSVSQYCVTIKQFNESVRSVTIRQSVSQHCVTIKQFNQTSLSQYCVTTKQSNYQCDLFQSDKSVSQHCVTIKQFNQTSLSQYCVTIKQFNESVRSVTIRHVSESTLCDIQTHLHPRAYSRPAIRYRLHLHVNALQLQTHAIKRSCSLTLSFKQILLAGSHKS
jgi:hypothetical protein